MSGHQDCASAREPPRHRVQIGGERPILRDAGLVTARREGVFVHYSLAGDDVLELWLSLRAVAADRLAEVERAARAYLGGEVEAIGRKELAERVRSGDLIVVDVRPAPEFEAGHIRQARSIPIDELERRLDELPPGVEVVSTLGPGERMALLEEYRAADLFVFPTRKEHMGLVLAEAAAAGLPLIATAVGGTSQIVRHAENGYLMPYDATAGDWARAILDLLADGPRRARFGEAARDLAVREFSQEALRENVEWALETAAR